MLTLVLGGARSGKSRIAQSICASGSKVTCIATAQIEDNEMRARISRHRSARPRNWITIEEPLAIADAVATHAASAHFILLDCLTLWLSNFCSERRDSPADSLEADVRREISRLVAASAASHVVAVSNEVGGGIVPESPVGRAFRDLHGLMNQHVAGEADFVYQMIAGIPLQIKPAGGPPILGSTRRRSHSKPGTFRS
jgi:adenosylcobinamide kinase/adenosylcobinamide-phosphate guanylyltransferase